MSSDDSGVGARSGSGPRLVVIGTPIGNLADLSPRAADALRSCDVIACEDTRRTGRLLELSGIRSPRLIRLDDHTEADVAERIMERVIRDRSVLGLVSDAGMPAIADPGSVLVSVAAEAGVVVEVVPGPFAGVVALVASALFDSETRFVFEGFLPRRSAQRRGRLGEFIDEARPVVIYESPHRLLATLTDMAEVLGADRAASVSRELTKMHEETVRGTLAELLSRFESSPPRGEFVIVIGGAAPPEQPTDQDLLETYRGLVADGMTSKDAIRSTADSHGVGANTVKRLVFSDT